MAHVTIDEHDIKDCSLQVLANTVEQAMNQSHQYLFDWINDSIPVNEQIAGYSYKSAYTATKTDREPRIKISLVSRIYYKEGVDYSNYGMWLVKYAII